MSYYRKEIRHRAPIRLAKNGKRAPRRSTIIITWPWMRARGSGYHENHNKFNILYTMRTWEDVVGKIEGKGKRSSRTKRRGAMNEGTLPGSERGSGPDRLNGIHEGNRGLERIQRCRFNPVLLSVNCKGEGCGALSPNFFPTGVLIRYVVYIFSLFSCRDYVVASWQWDQRPCIYNTNIYSYT